MVLVHVVGGLLLIASFIGTAAAQPSLNLTVSSVTAPAGSTAQFQISASAPQAINSGELVLDLDPSVFASVTAVSAFSAFGDASGWAAVIGLHVDVNFSSASGGVGLITGLPLIAITAAILPNAMPGYSAAVSASGGSAPWYGSVCLRCPVQVTPGTMTIGGTLSIADVESVTGPLSAGSIVQIDGTGFAASTAVDIQGAAIASTAFVSSTRIDVTLAGPTELTGKRVRVTNPDGSHVDFFPAWSGPPLPNSPGSTFANALPILPLQAFPEGSFFLKGYEATDGWFVLQNPNADPVDVAITTGTGPSIMQLSIPAGGSNYTGLAAVSPNNGVSFYASAPIRMLQLLDLTSVYDMPPYSGPAIPQAGAVSGSNFTPVTVQPSQDSLAWTWQTGTALPAPQTFNVTAVYWLPSLSFTVSAATASGGSWLSVTPSSGTTCAGAGCTGPQVTVSVDPTGLAPGIYRGCITLTPVASPLLPEVLPTVMAVALTVSSVPFGPGVVVNSAVFGSGNEPQSFPIPATLFPAGFSVAVRTDNGGNWLSATPATGTAPTTVTVSVTPGALLSRASTTYSGEVTVTGSGNTMVIFVLLEIPYLGVLADQGQYLQFSARVGDPAPPAQSFGYLPPTPAGISVSATVSTADGANWLSASASSSGVTVAVNPASLAPGNYFGVVNLTSSAGSGPVPVLLTVWTGPVPALSANPSSFTTLAGGAIVPQQFCVSTGTSPVTFSAQASTQNGGDWLSVTLADPVTPSCSLVALLNESISTPGTYSGSITLAASGQTLVIPVTMVVPPPAAPLLGAVVNSASSMEGAIAPGEIVTIYGVGVGPFAGEPGVPQVLFGPTPANVLYFSAGQINAVVPEAVVSSPAVNLQVAFEGQSTSWILPVTAASPAIFTLNYSGQGAGAVLNQDNSVNSPSNPAARGSVIQIFGTGVSAQSIQPVSVSIGGASALVEYAGPAPGATGLYQVNAVVPSGIAPGPAVPIVFSVGSISSQSGVTVAVQ